MSLHAVIIESALIEENYVEITGTGVNMTIIFMSDFQRNNPDPVCLQRAVDLANAKNPDLILLGGDYIEHQVDEFPSIYPLKSLKSRYGVYGVTGNHDYSVFGFAREVGGDPVLAQHVINFFQNSSSVNGTENNDDGDMPITIIRNEK